MYVVQPGMAGSRFAPGTSMKVGSGTEPFKRIACLKLFLWTLDKAMAAWL